MIDRLADIVREHARTRGDAPAITCGDHTMTYRELDERSSRVAQGLLALGAGPGSRIAHLDKNRPEFFELLFGAAKIGAVSTPVNWRLTPEEIKAIVSDAQAVLVVAGQEFAETAHATGTRVMISSEDYAAWRDGQRAEDPEHIGDADDITIQLYTSGTTGLPKGVLISDANLDKLQEVTSSWRLDTDSVSLVAMPLYHIGGSGWGLVGLHNGAHLVLVPDFDPGAVLDLMERHRVSNAFLVPVALQFLCMVPGAAERDWSALRAIHYGASPITSTVLRTTMETFGCPLMQVYGLTETTGAIVQLEPQDHHDHLLRAAGRPYSWVEIKIISPVDGSELPLGEPGEVWVRSPQNVSGYWNKPDETAALLPGDGWLRTGDAGYLDRDGYLFLTDRVKDMIVSGGENVYPIEVEEALAQHPDVADVAVIGVPDEKWGEAVQAIVVPREGAELTEDTLIEWARERVAGFKRPRGVDFTDALPRNLSGKLLKKVLREPYWSGRDRGVH